MNEKHHVGLAAILLREPARPAAVREHPLAPWFAVATVCAGAFMGQLDASAVTLAFPALQRQFAVGLADVQWVSLAYLLTLVVLLVPAGRWSDRFGRKLTYGYGFMIFTAASAACGLAGSLTLLIAFRVVQAAGAALLQANSVALVTTSTPAGSRRAALAIQAAAQALGLGLGPLLGGVLVDSASWRWIFFLNVPVGIVAVVTAWYLLPRTRTVASRRAGDPLGFGLLAAAAAAALLVASGLSGAGLPVLALAGCAAAAVVAAPTLIWHERRSAAPLVDVAMLGSAGTGRALCGALCAYLALFGPLVLIPQIVSAHGQHALRAGLLLAALPAGIGLAAVAGERLLPAGWSNSRRCAAGGVLATCSLAGLAVPAPGAVTALLLGIAGVGLGCYLPANNAAIMAAGVPQDAATAGAMVNMARGLGTACGVAVVTMALHAGTLLGPPGTGTWLAVAAITAAALIATITGRAAPSGPRGAASPGQAAACMPVSPTTVGPADRRRTDDH